MQWVYSPPIACKTHSYPPEPTCEYHLPVTCTHPLLFWDADVCFLGRYVFICSSRGQTEFSSPRWTLQFKIIAENPAGDGPEYSLDTH